jgi:uncharacterized surface protein with fasciclin (FAS1) repeats
MKTIYCIILLGVWGCSPNNKDVTETTPTDQVAEQGGQSNVKDDDSEKNVIQVAVLSPDHTTLVAALKAATYTDALSNAGPFTIFAPTDAAFKKLPEGTVDDLMKPENKDKLRNILEYHVYVGVIRENMIHDGMILNQVNGNNITLNKTNDKLTINGANVLSVVSATNGIIYVVDHVLIPPSQ